MSVGPKRLSVHYDAARRLLTTNGFTTQRPSPALSLTGEKSPRAAMAIRQVSRLFRQPRSPRLNLAPTLSNSCLVPVDLDLNGG